MPSNNQGDLLPGVVVNSVYTIKKFLGRGGFADTYLASDGLNGGDDCVVKRLHEHVRGNPQAEKLFTREAEVLKHLRHDAIPRLRAYFKWEDHMWLVQDYVPGPNLDDHLRLVTRMDEADVTKVVLQVLEVLKYLHTLPEPIIHRDIKPSNLIITSDNKVHVIDFGIVGVGLGGQTTTKFGTPGYTPNEQVNGVAVPSSDLHALGATALTLISGSEPREFYSTSDGKISWRGRIRCSENFGNFIERTLTDVSDRVRTAEEARALLLRKEIVEGPTVFDDKPSAASRLNSQGNGVSKPVAPKPGIVQGGSGKVVVSQSRRTMIAAVAVTSMAVAFAIWKSGLHPFSQRASDASPLGSVVDIRDRCEKTVPTQFRTESPVNLSVLCPENWSPIKAKEVSAEGVALLDDSTQVWANVWNPLANESLSAFSVRWRNSMQTVVGELQLDPQPVTEDGLMRFLVRSKRLPQAAPGSLQIQSSRLGANRYFVWSLMLGGKETNRAEARRVLMSISAAEF